MSQAIDSGVHMSAAAHAAFEREWRATCSCPRLSIVEVDGRMRCGCCDGPILRRRRVESVVLDSERRAG